jgi:hypothetical protein
MAVNVQTAAELSGGEPTPADCDAWQELRRLDGALAQFDAQADGRVVHLAAWAEKPWTQLSCAGATSSKDCQTAGDTEERVAERKRKRK